MLLFSTAYLVVEYDRKYSLCFKHWGVSSICTCIIGSMTAKVILKFLLFSTAYLVVEYDRKYSRCVEHWGASSICICIIGSMTAKVIC